MSNIIKLGSKERFAFGLMHQLHFGQRRKLSGLPFSVHPTQVHDLMCKWNVSKTTRIASILHDTVEDTTMTTEEMTRLFWPDVTSTVLAVSERKKTAMDSADKKATWRERKEKKLKSIIMEPHETVLLFFGDKVANLSETIGLIRGRNHFENNFNCTPEEMCWYFRESVKIVKDRFLGRVIDPYPFNFGEKDIRSYEDHLDLLEVKTNVSSFNMTPQQKE
ncbi:MAG: HD domain-containing protein [Candidatus Pacebacteria bacterium]|nr:HD domain-containing protein [Candidatus Paceibacterota bacterium]MBP9852326.1 HD domain-containing protein [Candidatus Paceibacterota bacterium]